MQENRINEFELCEHLVLLKNISEQYPEGRLFCSDIEKVLKQITSSLFRVAVIGEFKRGKSSLLNALLGTSVLPTDVLPTTSTLNKIVYSNKKEITIVYKNGECVDKNISDLLQYGTKLSENSEINAETIQEIIVHYPSVFCKNNIELIDTPGLNDDERMTEITLRVLKDIDTAIVVISAKMPLSLTEQNLIVRLLECEEIHDITFVITFIDAVSSRKSEQDRMIEYIKSRISNEVMENANKRYAITSNDKFINKANRVLSNPRVFAVSSTLAMEGFIKDSEELLEESRFPDFKRELTTILTVQQEMMIYYKTSEILTQVENNISLWYEGLLKLKAKEINELNGKRTFAEQFFKNLRGQLERELVEVDNITIETVRQIDPEKNGVYRIFINNLCTLTEDILSAETVKQMIEKSRIEAKKCVNDISEQIKNKILTTVKSVTENYKLKLENFFQDYNFKISISEINAHEFPRFCIDSIQLYPINADLSTYDVMPFLKESIQREYNSYICSLDSYLRNWIKDILLHNENNLKYKSDILSFIEASLSNVKDEIIAAQTNYKLHTETISEIKNNSLYNKN